MATQPLTLTISLAPVGLAPVGPTALLSRCVGQPFVFLLDGGDERSWGCGHALLGFRPRAVLRIAADGTALVRDGAANGAAQRWCGDPFALLDRFCAEYGWPAPSERTPFAGGVIAALSYDLRHWVERLPRRTVDDTHLPVLHAAAYDWVLSYSYREQRYQLASARCTRAELDDVASELQRLAAAPEPQTALGVAPPQLAWTLSRAQYGAAVDAILKYIAAGDTYQVNFAQRLVVQDPPAPVTVFSRMQRAHPVPFAAYVDGGEFVLLSNSPECFLSVGNGHVSTFPIKGTRRRSVDVQMDRELVAELQQDPKERAEHIMIVDLERNDLGRVCCPGSVRVEELARVHSFPSLHHLISKVSGRLRGGTTLADLLRATFPGGSITGAPKIRAMEIIDELEPVGRRFYTGAIGFIGRDGSAIFNLAIRTAVASAGRVTYHAGGGIVADSDPGREHAETLLKAEPFLAALRLDSNASSFPPEALQRALR